MIFALALGWIGLAAWLYLLLARGGFWRANILDEGDMLPEPNEWPNVTAVIPARNEADAIPGSLPSLLTQDYPKSLTVILVDDQSSDGTATAAFVAAEAAGCS